MTNPSTARARRARVRRTSAAVLLAFGLTLSTATVASAQAPSQTPAPTAPSVVGLKKGAYGEAVKALQEALVRVGVGVKYGVDSYFGSATQASVKAFQRWKGLPVTGVVDQATAAAGGGGLARLAAMPSAAAAGAAERRTRGTGRSRPGSGACGVRRPGGDQRRTRPRGDRPVVSNSSRLC